MSSAPQRTTHSSCGETFQINGTPVRFNVQEYTITTNRSTSASTSGTTPLQGRNVRPGGSRLPRVDMATVSNSSPSTQGTQNPTVGANEARFTYTSEGTLTDIQGRVTELHINSFFGAAGTSQNCFSLPLPSNMEAVCPAQNMASSSSATPTLAEELPGVPSVDSFMEMIKEVMQKGHIQHKIPEHNVSLQLSSTKIYGAYENSGSIHGSTKLKITVISSGSEQIRKAAQENLKIACESSGVSLDWIL